MKKSLILGFVFAGILGSNLNASCTKTGCTDKINTIYVTSTGKILVGTDGNEKALNCAGGGVSGVYVSVNQNAKGANQIYSLLLTAKSMGKKVKLRIVEGSKYCDISYATLAD